MRTRWAEIYRRLLAQCLASSGVLTNSLLSPSLPPSHQGQNETRDCSLISLLMCICAFSAEFLRTHNLETKPQPPLFVTSSLPVIFWSFLQHHPSSSSSPSSQTSQKSHLGQRTAENCTEFDSGSQVKKSPGSSLFVRACSVAKLCLTLCRPMDCSPPASPVYRIFQARILGWVAITLSRGSSQPKDQTHNSCIAGRFFTTEPPGRPLYRAKQITSPP